MRFIDINPIDMMIILTFVFGIFVLIIGIYDWWFYEIKNKHKK